MTFIFLEKINSFDADVTFLTHEISWCLEGIEREEALSGHAFNLNVWWIYFSTIENVVFNIFNIFNVTS